MGKEIKARKHLKAASSSSPPLPPPPPPQPTWSSYTRREIEKYWMKKRSVEEEHLLAAIKAAARIRASHFSEEDYKLFVESLEESMIKDDHANCTQAGIKEDFNNQEIRVGIKDWWTRSKYAYLNQPAVNSSVRPNRRSNYTPNNIYTCATTSCWCLPLQSLPHPKPLALACTKHCIQVQVFNFKTFLPKNIHLIIM